MATRIVYAKATAVLAHAGDRVRIGAGELWDGDDPLVTRYPDMFVDAPNVVRSTATENGYTEVEQATAAPGEKRSVRRSRNRDSGAGTGD